MLSVPVRILAAFFLVLMVPVAAFSQERLALIIGNSDYELVTSLDNPGNDASDLAASLEGLDFDVFLGLDVTYAQMTDLIDRFGEASKTADVILFFYAGHGFQVSGENYLVPTDSYVQKVEDVLTATIPMSRIISRMEEAPGLKFVLLDACRNNPFGENLRDAGAPVADGLARIGNAADFLISFATQPDNVAYDGTGRNSFFTEALLSHLNTPGQDVSDMLISVRKDVIAATGGRQIPWENSSLTRQFQFDTRPSSVSPEALLWQVAASGNDSELMRLYVDRYPQGPQVELAMAFLEGDDGQGSVGTSLTRDASPLEQDEQADRLWQLAQRSRMRPLVKLYLDQYPAGRNATDARRLLASLPNDDEIGFGRRCERLATHPRDATASIAGIPFSRLALNAETAIQVCRAAAEESPDLPHYIALQARATAALGDMDAAVRLYETAASRGDLRAMVSLGLITESGQGVPANLTEALRLYDRAARGGSPDGMINLAVALFQGAGVDQDIGRAVDLLKQAANLGSPIATYNLGVLTQNGTTGSESEALGYFQAAARNGEPRGYVSGAILLDEGRGVARDPDAAAVMLLRGAVEDSGQAVAQMTQNTSDWSVETIAAVQSRLKDAGYYTSAVDGLSGPNFTAALDRWRNGGFKAEVLM